MQGKKPGGSSGGGRSGELQGDEAQRNKKKKKKVSCFSNIKIFLVSECALMLAQGTVGAYLVSVLTTLERRFNLQSADVGVIASSFEIGNLALILFVSYFGARGHRPRLIGCGGIVMALGALLSALPEFLTHQYKYEAGEIHWGAEGRDVCATNGSSSDEGPDPDLICRNRTATNMMYLLLIGAQVLLGIGATPVQPLGVSYIDDHVRRKDSSLYIGILFTMLVFGPACGFILGSFCTKIYVDAVFIDTSNLDITPDDPRWIGAWWAGFLLCGALLFFSSLLMFGFPQSLPPHSDPGMESEQAMLPEREYERPKPSNGVLRHPLEPDSSASCFQQLKVIPKVTKHLLSNPVFTCIVLAACMEIAVVAGFAAFLGKYLEQQFNLTTSSANQLLGMTAIPCACLGIFLGGLLVKKLSLSALGAIRMAMMVNLVSTACYVSFLFLGCDTGPVAGVTVPYGNNSARGSALDPYSQCNNNCECQTDSFTPVCGADGVTYLSACFAGCNSTNFTGCACLTTVPPENATVVPGKCPSPGCQEAFLTFLCVMCVCSLIGAMAQTPSVIILIRTVSPELKSYALGVLFLLLRLLGFIPPPLIFGAGIDSTCLFWSTFCGEQGACVLYDNVVYRYLYVSIAIALKSFAFILYTTTWQCLRKNYKRYIKNHEGGLSTSTEYQDIETEKTCPESQSPSEDSFVRS
ncbi:solute carrier organic anion transporter family member 3A1 isoform X3 [Meriones unguiculatus]|uniref:solute carrier organic anion transporter family member 3A1 isoform X2 n=1 Tax=Psammomys obesus TaxID=48139 RepID=UPI002453101C|nr:solute carrier organic anion transporter family member 3A1 isoform X2 [Psammomys obesus]XP_060223336.1 solute carrier organic anion transporter family member 3A1 isoform X3 [Meriones unguiculatus]